MGYEVAGVVESTCEALIRTYSAKLWWRDALWGQAEKIAVRVDQIFQSRIAKLKSGGDSVNYLTAYALLYVMGFPATE